MAISIIQVTSRRCANGLRADASRSALEKRRTWLKAIEMKIS
jgi:hypothetical protein